MARHKKMEEAEEPSANMDISSLIDCCFLLLLYFIVCTSIVQERQLDMKMPGQVPSESAKTPLEPGLVVIDAAGVVYWGKAGGDQIVIDSDPLNHELPELVSALQTFKDKAESTGSKPIVQLRVDGTVPHQRFIDVMNAFTKGGINEVGLTNVSDD